MIRVFEPGAKVFNSLGLKVIQPYKTNIREEDNGDYYLDLECGLEDIDVIKHDYIIVANTPNPDYPYEPFRVGNITVTRKKISARCPHLTDDLKGYYSCPPNTSYYITRNIEDSAEKSLWEQGGLDIGAGTARAADTEWRSANFLSDDIAEIRSVSAHPIAVFIYAENGAFLEQRGFNMMGASSMWITNTTFNRISLTYELNQKYGVQNFKFRINAVGYGAGSPLTGLTIVRLNPVYGNYLNGLATSIQQYIVDMCALCVTHPDSVWIDGKTGKPYCYSAKTEGQRTADGDHVLFDPKISFNLEYSSIYYNTLPRIHDDDGKLVTNNALAYKLVTDVFSIYDGLLYINEAFAEEYAAYGLTFYPLHLIRHGNHVLVTDIAKFEHSTDIVIEYGVNLMDIEANYDYSDSTTQIYFKHGGTYWGDVEYGVTSQPRMLWDKQWNGETMNTAAFNPDISQFARPYQRVIDLDYNSAIDSDKYQAADESLQAKTTAKTQYDTALIMEIGRKAIEYGKKHSRELARIGVASYTVKANVEGIHGLGDRVRVNDRYLGINDYFTVEAYEYDCLSKKFKTIEINSGKKSLKSKISRIKGV